MTGDWEETQRINLYRKIAKALESKSLSEEDLEKIKEIVDKSEEE